MRSVGRLDVPSTPITTCDVAEARAFKTHKSSPPSRSACASGFCLLIWEVLAGVGMVAERVLHLALSTARAAACSVSPSRLMRRVHPGHAPPHQSIWGLTLDFSVVSFACALVRCTLVYALATWLDLCVCVGVCRHVKKRALLGVRPSSSTSWAVG